MDERLHLLGIRHHGPGSAALLLDALERADPQAVLIEGSPEADDLIPYAALSGMKPPVALLSYCVEKPRLAVFSPFAEFSPEWQAMRWALAKGRTVRFIDWPVSVSLAALAEEAAAEEAETEEAEAADAPSPEIGGSETPAAASEAPPQTDVDPLDLLAEAAGYEDGEAFWNALIEQRTDIHRDALAVFAAIETAMTEARSWQEENRALGPNRVMREAHREAFMRQNLRQALKETEGKIAAVVGAWHLAGLRAETTAAADKALVKDLPRVKTATLWVPWSNGRLALRSGYGAGIQSPGWYGQLWKLYRRSGGFDADDFVSHWQAKTASILRDAGYAASTAGALEAARLAISLAALRGLSGPGLAEMREAALAALCQGSEAPLQVIEEKLYVGDELGALDPAIPQTPLASDLEAWQRRTRLQPKTEPEEISLDLRSDAGLLKSTLLHRLALIGIPWGTLVDAEAGRGTFREIWRLQWQVEFAVALAEALVYGVTIEEAAAGKARATAEASSSIRGLAELVRATLVADLAEAAGYAIDCLRRRALDSCDMDSLMLSVPPLVQILRYGTARRMPEAELRSLVHALAVEINAGMRVASYGLDEDAAAGRRDAMTAWHQAVTLHGDAELSEEWLRQLALLVRDENAAPGLAGFGLRRLHESGGWETAETERVFSWRINGQEPASAAAFLEGFIGTDAEILLHDRFLLPLIDGWMQDLDEEAFIQVIPLLRRGFSSFDGMARRRLFLALFEEKRNGPSIRGNDGENPAFAAALPLLYRILGVTQ